MRDCLLGLEHAFLRADIAEGKSAFFVMSGPQGTLHVRAEYQRIEPPHCLVYTQQFVDAHEQPAPAPAGLPARLENTVLFTQEGPNETRVTLTTDARGEFTPAQLDAFIPERAGMALGWGGSFDALEALL